MMTFFIFIGWCFFDAYSPTTCVLLIAADLLCGDRK